MEKKLAKKNYKLNHSLNFSSQMETASTRAYDTVDGEKVKMRQISICDHTHHVQSVYLTTKYPAAHFEDVFRTALRFSEVLHGPVDLERSTTVTFGNKAIQYQRVTSLINHIIAVYYI